MARFADQESNPIAQTKYIPRGGRAPHEFPDRQDWKNVRIFCLKFVITVVAIVAASGAIAHGGVLLYRHTNVLSGLSVGRPVIAEAARHSNKSGQARNGIRHRLREAAASRDTPETHTD
jgi:hypothetical protein